MRALLATLRKEKLSAQVTAAGKAVAEVAGLNCPGAAGGLRSGGAGAGRPRLDGNKSLGRIRRTALVAYDEDLTGYQALFAAARTKLLQAPRRRREAARPVYATP